MSMLKDPVLGPRLLASLASSCITLDVISLAMAVANLFRGASDSKSTADDSWTRHLIQKLRIATSATAIVLAAIYLNNFFAPPFSCGPLYASWAFYFINQVSLDALLLIRIFVFKPSAWVRWISITSLVLIDLVLRAIYFAMSKVAVTSAGICATIPDPAAGFTLFGSQVAFYVSIAVYFSYIVSVLQHNAVLSASPVFKRFDRLSKGLFLSIFVAQLGLYTPFYFSSLGSSTIVLVHILIAVQTLLINLSFELSKIIGDNGATESRAKGQRMTSTSPMESAAKRAELHVEGGEGGKKGNG